MATTKRASTARPKRDGATPPRSTRTKTKTKTEAPKAADERPGTIRRIRRSSGGAIQLVHNAGCPMVMEAPQTDPESGRMNKEAPLVEISAIETFSDVRPKTEDRPARKVKVTRCRRCGAQVVTRPEAEIVEVVEERYDDEEEQFDGEEDDEAIEGGGGGS